MFDQVEERHDHKSDDMSMQPPNKVLPPDFFTIHLVAQLDPSILDLLQPIAVPSFRRNPDLERLIRFIPMEYHHPPCLFLSNKNKDHPA